MQVVNEKEVQYLYRYNEIHVSLGCDYWGDPLPGHKVEIWLEEYPIVKRTPKGVWINLYSHIYPVPLEPSWTDGKKFVNLEARKKYACLTKEEALESFKARKRKQINILKGQLKDAEQALKIAENGVQKLSGRLM